jgi:hypothetical protein
VRVRLQRAFSARFKILLRISRPCVILEPPRRRIPAPSSRLPVSSLLHNCAVLLPLSQNGRGSKVRVHIQRAFSARFKIPLRTSCPVGRAAVPAILIHVIQSKAKNPGSFRASPPRCESPTRVPTRRPSDKLFRDSGMPHVPRASTAAPVIPRAP